MNKKITLLLLLLTLIALVGAPAVLARPDYLKTFNTRYNTSNTRLDTCDTCHDKVPPVRNPYGMDIANQAGTTGQRLATIETSDSDRDGFNNLEEIRNLTFPGNPDDMPGDTLTTAQTPTPASASTQTPTAPGFGSMVTLAGLLTTFLLDRRYNK